MLQAQMPVSMAVNSFKSDKRRSVESENSGSLDKNKFTKIYKSASIERRKVRKDSPGEKSITRRADKSDFSESVKKLNLKPVLLNDTETTDTDTLIKKGKRGITESEYNNLSPSVKGKKDRIKDSEELQISLPNAAEDSEIDDKTELREDFNKFVGQKPLEVSTAKGEGIVADNVPSSSEVPVGIGNLTIFRPESRTESGTRRNKAAKKSVKMKSQKLRVVDLRETEQRSGKSLRTGIVVKSAEEKIPVVGSEQEQSVKAEDAKPIVVEMVHLKDNFSGESKTLTTTTSSSLMRQLEETVNNKIVKQSSIILKDDNTGEIKLILKPEFLGRVRIRLNLQENRSSVQIIGENSALKVICEQNLHNLESAFKENGFDTASLNVSVGGNGTGYREREENSDLTKHIEMIDEIIPTMVEESDNLIDLVV
ncbi:MAG: flagellar hook-length control protein FliK [Spirochaetales bacterium]|nr:flagellar hook-length control protein FliK [Spirochaetales bacterium]